MAETINFTVKRLQDLPTPERETVVYDAGTARALAVRLRPTGGKTFVCRYRVSGAGVAGKPRWFVIGPVDKVNLDEARRKAAHVMAEARAGRDPAAERKAEARAAALTAPELSVGELIDLYEAAQKKHNIKSAELTAKRLRKSLASYLAHPAADMTRAAFVKILDATTPGTVPTLQANIHGLLAHGQNAGLLAQNVMAGYKRPRGSKKEQNLARASKVQAMLTMAEIAAIWRGCDAPTVNKAFGCYIRTIIIAGTRREELSFAEHSWLRPATPDEPAHMLIPGKHTKNGKVHYLPLPPLAAGVIAQSPRIAGCDLVFPGGVSRKTGKHAKISGWSKTWPKVAAAAKRFGLSRHVTIHQLRKALRSHYSRMGFVELGRRQLNQITGDVLDEIYDQYDRKAERIAAAERWCAEIEAAVAVATPNATPADVVPLRKPATARRPTTRKAARP